MAVEQVDDEIEKRPAILLDNMLNGERKKDLWLASTPDGARSIVMGWPEFSALRLYGDNAATLIADKLRATNEDDSVTVLLTLAEYIHNRDTLNALAEKVIAASAASLSQENDLLLNTFRLVSDTLLHRDDTRNAIIDRARTILNR